MRLLLGVGRATAAPLGYALNAQPVILQQATAARSSEIVPAGLGHARALQHLGKLSVHGVLEALPFLWQMT